MICSLYQVASWLQYHSSCNIIGVRIPRIQYPVSNPILGISFFSPRLVDFHSVYSFFGSLIIRVYSHCDIVDIGRGCRIKEIRKWIFGGGLRIRNLLLSLIIKKKSSNWSC